MRLNIGDLVTAGKELMTVERVDDNGVHCVWFDKDDQLQRFAFDSESVIKVTPKDGEVK